MNLFEYARKEQIEREAPLAARMRPRTLDEFVGQEHILGPGRLLRRAIQADQLSSLIFYGPPGTGKTTLAMVIANTTKSHFITINAVLAGVKDIREAITEAQERRNLYNQRTILFVDEVHRWNKAQQDALLPWVENGTVILIGATTENPYFEVIKPLVSRSRIFQLKPLTNDDLCTIARRALADPERGYGRLKVDLHPDALDHLVNVANGDARALLNALELAVETTPPNEDGVIIVDMSVAEESIQRRAVLYDKDGDVHYDTISAFIKSLRGSDPDAALYWLAKMVYAGEDPRFIFRRMLIFAGEDVGLADPNAVRVVVACAEAFDRVGLPEGRFHLAEAALYLATAPKSNSAMGFFDALAVVEQEREAEVPVHLKDGSRDREGFGHGVGYLYPHAYRDHWVAQQYLPDALQGQIFYQPSDQGYEASIKTEVERRREAQLAAMLEGERAEAVEQLSTAPLTHRSAGWARWLERTLSQAGEYLGQVRDTVLDNARLQRHYLVLDVGAGTGLLTWEALRRVPEGGVWAVDVAPDTVRAIKQQAANLPELQRPVVLEADACHLPLASELFDAVVARSVLIYIRDKAQAAREFYRVLRPGGCVSLFEPINCYNKPVVELIDHSELDPDLVARIRQEHLDGLANPDDPMLNFDEHDLERIFAEAGFKVTLDRREVTHTYTVTPQLARRWFHTRGAANRPTLSERLRTYLTSDELARYEQWFIARVVNRTLEVPSVVVYLTGVRPG
ncbi:MAG TPA: AAA family ATPase [Anaerolineae bacterium]|nr:AAA family ATPase [Anaerolineae bacterium]